MKVPRVRYARPLLGAGVLIAGLVGGTLTARHSHAAYGVCRTDPSVTLENGRVVTLYADISASPAQIARVTYVLHVPNSTAVAAVSYDQYGYLEALTVLSDRNGHHYSMDAAVTMSDGSVVDVTVHMSVSGQSSGDAGGHSGQTLSLSM